MELKSGSEFVNPFLIVVALQIQYCSEIGQTGNAGKRYVNPFSQDKNICLN